MHDQPGTSLAGAGSPSHRSERAAWLAARVPTWIAWVLIVVWAYQLRYLVFASLYLRLEDLGHEVADDRARLIGNTAGLAAIVLPCLLLAVWHRAWRPTSGIGRALRHVVWPVLVASGGLGWSIAAALWGRDGPLEWPGLLRWILLHAAIAAAVALVGGASRLVAQRAYRRDLVPE